MYPKTLYLYIKYPNMADIWVARFCAKNKIDRVCLKKEDNWIKTDFSVQSESICEI